MEELNEELRSCYGEDAKFREGQAEAILGVLQGERTLVVQKTGWGKSLVYFLATKILRRNKGSITLIISPLLVLMNNQVDAANKLGLQVRTIHSDNKDDWDKIMNELNANKVDALIISPERLANESFMELFIKRMAVNIGLFVVDEAHCISDWGHDFRPDYRRIVDIVRMLPSNIPVLATTATANNRVVADIKKQLGEGLHISRGSLMRESLAIQVIELNSKEERLAWITDHIDMLQGTGIVYCLTVRDCKLVHKWLQKNGVTSECYYSNIDNAEQKDKNEIISKFMKNEIKVLVATVAFGMGFDKADISFVIHFQKPGTVVAYYQQIGRAGRAIQKAYAILMCGSEDDEINNYFIESAFPTEELMNEIVKTLREHPGIRQADIEKYINMKPAKIKACLKYLLVNGDIYKEKSVYYKAAREWKPDLEKSGKITEVRKAELRQMNDFVKISECYMKYIAHILDDDYAIDCGKCSNCQGTPLFPTIVSAAEVAKAQQFIKEDFNIIEPRKKWPSGKKIHDKNAIESDFICQTGRVLSNYGDAGWGKLVARGKYEDGCFDDRLITASYDILKDFVKENDIKWVTNISSRRRPELVKDFAEKLALRLGLIYKDVICKKTDTVCQKELNTSYLQFHNAFDSFEVSEALKENVLLVDDMVDSRWTFTVCGYKLIEKGCGKVFPFALANTAGRNGDE
ncbi:MAG: ATP-dependent DNA helicase RecQ [Lachnospiraceae bacterium]|nr:ATP-dependent DNA helicase RecQ [Lachnospiraceae bacterium]